MRPYTPTIPHTIGELFDKLGWMMLEAPRFNYGDSVLNSNPRIPRIRGHYTYLTSPSAGAPRMARLARAVAAGVPHHVTQRGNWRQQTFFSDEDYGLYRDLVAESRAKAQANPRTPYLFDIPVG